MSLRPYARLVRLPNLPTPLADIGMAALAVGALPGRWLPFVLLLLASASLYMAGMVLNDYFDFEEDRRDRPERPLPAGQISLRGAMLLGVGLLAAGAALALAAGLVLAAQDETAGWARPAVVALLLAGAIVAYDAGLKQTALGPVAMGSCRFFNVLLGVSLSGGLSWPLGPHLAFVVGLYIVGVTTFARSETQRGDRLELAVSAGLILTALVLALGVPTHRPEDTASPLFVYLLVALGFFLSFPLIAAVREPSPAQVQAGVRRCLMSLILLDTVLAVGTAGSVGLVLLVLMLPSVWLNRQRWLYAT